jgi:hypothetical protein
MSSPVWLSRLMILVLAFVLLGGPQLLSAQQTAPASTPANTTDDQNVGTTPQSATPDPSKGPLQPNDTALPNAPSTTQQQQDQNQQPEVKEQPLGAAAAQAGPASGGPASRPAGTAIAPAKQHQTRALLIKIGAIAAGAAAVGVIYGLSRGTPSLPPGASTTSTAAQQPGH